MKFVVVQEKENHQSINLLNDIETINIGEVCQINLLG
jgi:hypothetical protein